MPSAPHPDAIEMTSARPSSSSRLPSSSSSRPHSLFQPANTPGLAAGSHPTLSRAHSNPTIALSAAARRTSDERGADEAHGEEVDWRSRAHGSSPLERSIDKVGMGRYQWTLLALAGCGWAADNMWLQGIAIIIPRIQDEFDVSNRWIGLASSSMFAGMMLGSLAWGSFSDAYGRRPAFNLTLLITSIFGLLSSLSPSFFILCLLLFALGTGVGGSMPTDGTLFLENLPTRKQYLLTALSVFFAAGSVISSVLGLLILPRYGCEERGKCGEGMNRGWRYLLASLGVLTATFLILRVIFFKLWESPKYLVSTGRPQEARAVLQRIAAFNGAPLSLSINDLRQTDSVSMQEEEGEDEGRRSKNGDTTYDDLPDEEDESAPLQQGSSSSDEATPDTFDWPAFLSFLPASLRSQLSPFLSRYVELLTPPWRRTTLLTWSVWLLFSLAFTSFNVYLSKYLEDRLGKGNERQVMQDYVLYSAASLPGAIVGAWVIETKLGHRKTMAFSTLLVAVALFIFIFASTRFAIVLSSCSISLLVSVAYAAIYAHAPIAFNTRLRATGTGTASALSRFAGILAPVLAGGLLSVNENLPFMLAVGIFVVTAGLILALPGKVNHQGA